MHCPSRTLPRWVFLFFGLDGVAVENYPESRGRKAIMELRKVTVRPVSLHRAETLNRVEGRPPAVLVTTGRIWGGKSCQETDEAAPRQKCIA